MRIYISRPYFRITSAYNYIGNTRAGPSRNGEEVEIEIWQDDDPEQGLPIGFENGIQADFEVEKARIFAQRILEACDEQDEIRNRKK